jgi:hypothetical protein
MLMFGVNIVMLKRILSVTSMVLLFLAAMFLIACGGGGSTSTSGAGGGGGGTTTDNGGVNGAYSGTFTPTTPAGPAFTVTAQFSQSSAPSSPITGTATVNPASAVPTCIAGATLNISGAESNAGGLTMALINGPATDGSKPKIDLPGPPNSGATFNDVSGNLDTSFSGQFSIENCPTVGSPSAMIGTAGCCRFWNPHSTRPRLQLSIQFQKDFLMHTQVTPFVLRSSRAVTFATTVAVATLLLALVLPIPGGATPPASFTTTPLLLPNGSSEPEISIGNDGTMAMVSLQWLFDPTAPFGTDLWTGPFGSSPIFQGVVDGALQHPGKSIFGGEDADVDIGSTGRLHISTLIALVNPAFTRAQIGVSAITCPSPALSTFAISQCTEQIIDTTNSDRQWITSDGPHVYISYHDSRNAALIHVQRSDDDGFTWRRVGDPIVGQAKLTADATFNNAEGKIIADPHTHNVYDVYAAGETGVLKGRTFTPNHIVVSRSSDMGKTWTANVVFTAAPGTSLAHFVPALAVDSTNGNLYAAWSDGQSVSFASSTDQGSHWTSAVVVSTAPATTAIFPWVAANNGTVDIAYYGTSAASNLDPTADWHVYFAQFNGASFTQTQVNVASNHHGVICTNGSACAPGTRNLLDLFQVAIDPQNAKAAIIYVDDTLTTSSDPNNFACSASQLPPCPLPQAVLAQQN